MKHINVKHLAGVTAAALLMSSTALADTADSALVKGGSLNLRQNPSLSAKVLGQFPTGTLVEIIQPGADWHQVEVGGKTGYMMARYLNAGQQAQAATVRTNSGIGLNLREEPEMDGAILTSVKNGTSVTVTQKGREWCRVNIGGVEGFMATEFLVFANPSDHTGRVAIVSNPRDTQVLNLRQQPSLDSKVLAYYRNGARVTILESGKTWHKVQTADGKVGYMMTQFLQVTNDTAAVQPFQAKVVNINGGSYVNLRKAGSLGAKIIDRIDVGSTVTVIEHGTDWCRVVVDGVEGFMSTWFLRW